jgi:nucleoside 2-deoxyribosyltransferase
MKCFIASAFDRNDVDALYDQGIVPVLRKLRITPTRVDRVEHNDDIDDRIFALIEEAQFCIADLTYARPSVYYEAGYAFGSGKPVIYTARQDHFRAREDDTVGNLRVHFDLQMKNIIPWGEPNKVFLSRLTRRVRHVIGPLLRKECMADAKAKQAAQFAAMSQNSRLAEVLRKGMQLLRSRGYSGGLEDEGPLREDRYHAHLHRRSSSTFRHFHLIALPAFADRRLRMLYSVFYPSLPGGDRGGVQRIESLCVIIALQSVRGTRLAGSFPSWTPAGAKAVERNDLDHEGIRRHVRVELIDGIESIEDSTERLRALIFRLEGDQQGGAANERQPALAATNRTSVPAAARR